MQPFRPQNPGRPQQQQPPPNAGQQQHPRGGPMQPPGQGPPGSMPPNAGYGGHPGGVNMGGPPGSMQPPSSQAPPSAPSGYGGPPRPGMPPQSMPGMPPQSMPGRGPPATGPPMGGTTPRSISGPPMGGARPPATMSGPPMGGPPGPRGPPMGQQQPTPPMSQPNLQALRGPPTPSSPMGTPGRGPPTGVPQGPPGSNMPPARGPPMSAMGRGPPTAGSPMGAQGPPMSAPGCGAPPNTFSPTSMRPPPTAGQMQQGPPGAGGPPTAAFSQMSMGGPPGSQAQQPGAASPQAGGYGQPQQQQYGAGQPQYGGQQQYGQQQQQGGYRQQEPQTAVLSDAALAAQCDPKYMRMTVNSIPSSQEHAAKSKIPMGVVISPLADDDEEELSVVNFGASGVIRCKRCRTYINPFVQWVDNGRRWRCNLCGSPNDVPSSYFCHLGPDQQRQDLQDRPELRSGSVEIVAPAEYMMRPPQPPVYVFVIDVSANAMQSGMFHTCINAIKGKLDELPGAPRTRVGFITFDQTVHFYNIKSTLKSPQMMVVPDVAELFIPIPDDLLVNLSDSREIIDSLLDMLPAMHQNSRSAETALGPALRAAFRVMTSIGGKMLVFQTTLPSVGQGSLKHRENPRVFGTDKETPLLNSVDTFYRQNAIEFSRHQVSVDVFLFSQQYTDIATVGCISKYSAGQVFYYPGFHADTVGEKFTKELGHCLTRASGWEAVMRVRCTNGMRLSNFYGNSFMRGTDLLALPNVNADSTFAIEMTHSDALLSSSIVSVQAALLYTTSCGERRIRVHTMATPVTKLFAEVFRSADIDSLCNLMSKVALENALKCGLESSRNRLQAQCSDIIRAYRSSGAYGAQNTQGYQINLPESLQLLPLYVMALLKNPAFRGGADVRSDERTFLMHELNNMPVVQSRVFIYPRLFSLHDMSPECGVMVPDADEQEGVVVAGTDDIRLPPVINLSVERFRSDGIFLLEDTRTFYFWIGRASPPAMTMSLLGLNSLEGVDCSTLRLRQPTASDDFATRVHAILNGIREDRRPFMDVKIIVEGDQSEGRLYWKLVEDRASFSGGSLSYAEFLGHMNRQSQGTGN